MANSYSRTNKEESIVAKNRSAPKTPEVASSVKTFEEPLSKTKFQKALELMSLVLNFKKLYEKVPGPVPKIKFCLTAPPSIARFAF